MNAQDLDIVALQRSDHARMEELLRRYEAGQGRHDRRLYEAIVKLVTRHAFAEEAVLFPAARRILREAEPMTADIEQKHQRVNEAMAQLEALSPGEPSFEALAAEVFALLRSDAREEEDVLLRALAEVTSPARRRRIGVTWAFVRLAAPNRPHAHVSRRPPGNVLASLPLAVADRVKRIFAPPR